MSEKSKLKVWSRFQVEKNGSVIKFRIQDAPPDRKEDVVDFIMTHLLRDEAFHKAAGITFYYCFMMLMIICLALVSSIFLNMFRYSK